MRGGARVKFTRVLGLVVLLGCSVVVARADAGNDPTVKVNKFPDPTCPPAEGADYACFSVNDQAHPLIIPNESPTTPPVNEVWDGAGALTALFVEFTFQPGELYTCQSDIFLLCGTVAPSLNPNTDLEFEFQEGSIAPCTLTGDCTGVTAGVAAPEPNSALLLFAGLGCLLALAKRRSSRQTSGVRAVTPA